MKSIGVLRRAFIAALGIALVAWPLAADAQPQHKIGYLGLTTPNGEAEIIAAFGKGLRESGFEDGQNTTIEFRFAEGDVGRLATLVDDLIRREVDVIFTGTTAASVAAKKSTSSVPIVFVMGSDPIRTGLVAALNQPGGNVTGINIFTGQMEGKRLALLSELVPKVKLIGALLNPNNPFFEGQLKDLDATSQTLGIKIHIERASTEAQIAAAFKGFEQAKVGALLVGSDLYFTSRRALVINPARELRLPGIYEWRQFVDAGGVMSYGTSLTEAFRQGGGYVAKVLKGERPAEIPVNQVSKFELILNLKIAAQIGIEVPPNLSARGDDVVE